MLIIVIYYFFNIGEFVYRRHVFAVIDAAGYQGDSYGGNDGRYVGSEVLVKIQPIESERCYWRKACYQNWQCYTQGGNKLFFLVSKQFCRSQGYLPACAFGAAYVENKMQHSGIVGHARTENQRQSRKGQKVFQLVYI